MAAANESQDGSSPSVSALLPLGIRPRRGSTSSITSNTQVDKEVLTQALDHIHSTASRSSTLTTFNDFAPPPTTSASDNASTLPAHLSQSAIGGFYSRLKASVGATPAAGSQNNQNNQSSSGATLSKQSTSESLPKPAKAVASPPRTPRAATDSSALARTPETSPHPASRKGKKSVPSSPRSFAFDTSVIPSLDEDVASLTPSGSSAHPSETRKSVSDAVRNVHVSPEPGDKAAEAVPARQQQAGSPGPAKRPSSHHSTRSPGKDSSKSPSALTPINPIHRPSQTASVSEKDSASLKKREDTKNSEKQATGEEKRSDATQKPQLELPGFRLSRATSPDGSESVSSKQTSLNVRRGEQQSLGKPFEDGLRTTQPQPSFVADMKRKILSRDFWMKDENAKVCYNCGEPFSTFRRKHHCRLCGQIYCSACTNLISGKTFGQASKLRVCKSCEGMINGDDSSDLSDEDLQYSSSPQVKHIRFTGVRSGSFDAGRRSSGDIPTEFGSPQSIYSSPQGLRDRESKRKSTPTIGFERAPTIPRPSSSRSLKSMASRPRSSSQRRRWTQSQHMRSLNISSGSAPFHGDFSEDVSNAKSLPAFHTDSVIDPDLAPFMSDEGSSEDEAPSIAANLHTDLQDQSNGGFSGLVGAFRKNRPRLSSKGFMDFAAASREADTISLSSSRGGQYRRQLGRTISFGSLSRAGTFPRVIQSDNLFASSDALMTPGVDEYAVDNHADHPISQYELHQLSRPAAELHDTSLAHIKRMLRQFLDDQGVRHERRWEKALMPILLRCAGNIDPNIQRGDAIDIRHYIKLKKAEGGNPSDTSYVSGVVFSKNVALKGMPRKLKNPRILLLSFPLIYARHQQHFMSLDPVIAQEREYLRNLVNRIMTLKPNVILVQHNVSGVALQFLQEANVAVAYNVKESVMQAVSRCTQTRIVSSVDKLTMDRTHLGNCPSFEVKTFVHHSHRKTYIFFSGCQPDLGCTVVLRGASYATLRKMKWITEFMCYVVYNSKLETSLMRDQFIDVPAYTELVEQNGPEVTPNQEKTTGTATEDDTKPRPNAPDPTLAMFKDDDQNTAPSKDETLENVVPGGSYHDMVKVLQKRVLSISPLVNFPEPYLVLRGRDQEALMARLKHLQELQAREIARQENEEKSDANQKFELVKPEMIYATAQNTSPQVREILHAIHSAEYEKASHRYGTLKRRWDAYIAGAQDPFSPLTHQKVVMLFSIVSTHSGDACEGPDLLGLDFYQEHDINGTLEPDFPLGEYIERLCNQVNSPCMANRCEKKMLDHHRQYVHGDGQISIFIEKCPSKFRGMENTILMWSCCRICEQETQVTTMSRNSWKYSFGKYLELSFWSRALLPRADLCPHDVHRDHTRYFGFKNLAVKVQYDPINIVEVIVPRGRVTWKVEKDLKLKNDHYQRIENRMARFMASVKARIKSIKVDNVSSELMEACKAEIDLLTKRANKESEELIHKLQEKYMGSKYYEHIPLNRAVRLLQEKVADWDTAFGDFEKKYFPSEKDIHRLAAQQLKKVYLEQEASKSEEEADHEKHHEPNVGESAGYITNEKAAGSQNALEVMPNPTGLQMPETDEAGGNKSRRSSLDYEQQVVQNLDLAVPSSSPAASFVDQKASLIEQANMKSEGKAPAAPEKASKPNPDPNSAKTGTDIKAQAVSRDLNRSPSPQTMRSRLAPPLSRAQSQPVTQRLQNTSNVQGTPGSEHSTNIVNRPKSPVEVSKIPAPRVSDVKKVDQVGSSVLKGGKSAMQSMIPRAVTSKRIDSRVSALARHFEQMSREFEKERLRERRQRAVRLSQARAYPIAASKPIVEIYRDASEAVRERETSYEDHKDFTTEIMDWDGQRGDLGNNNQMAGYQTAEETQDVIDIPETGADDNGHVSQPEENTQSLSYPPSEAEGSFSDTEATSGTKEKTDSNASTHALTSPAESLAEVPLEIPKHEKSYWMKMLTSFWSERSASGWSPLEYPLLPTNHIFADSDVIVREDEPSSLVAFALESHDYSEKVQKFRDRVRIAEKEQQRSYDAGDVDSSEDLDVERVMLGKTATHMRYQFQSGSARMQCKVFFAEAFDAIRRKCGVSERFVESLARCMKWDSKGGKTKSLFLKTLDERFVLKSLSATETQAFLKFAPDYFDYMSKCLFHNLPSALAKMLGFYQVVIKNPITGTEFNYFLQVMENVFYESPSNRMFDLKGSMRNRKIQSTGEQNEVLLDENLLDYISQSPVYVRNHSNNILASSICNDTLFCSKQNVMDYSLIVGLYEDRKELLVGIIDYIRTYTWDKKLESWIKDRGKHKATVRSPKDYRNRFRASIPRYFPLAPSCWQVFGTQRIGQIPSSSLEVAGMEDERGDNSLTETGGEDEKE